MPNSIPQSQALAEADSNSLSELFSRDPEGYTRKDIDQVIAEMRAMRLKWDAAEKVGAKVRPVKVEGGNGKGKSLTSQQSAEDLGL